MRNDPKYAYLDSCSENKRCFEMAMRSERRTQSTESASAGRVDRRFLSLRADGGVREDEFRM